MLVKNIFSLLDSLPLHATRTAYNCGKIKSLFMILIVVDSLDCVSCFASESSSRYVSKT